MARLDAQIPNVTKLKVYETWIFLDVYITNY